MPSPVLSARRRSSRSATRARRRGHGRSPTDGGGPRLRLLGQATHRVACWRPRSSACRGSSTAKRRIGMGKGARDVSTRLLLAAPENVVATKRPGGSGMRRPAQQRSAPASSASSFRSADGKQRARPPPPSVWLPPAPRAGTGSIAQRSSRRSVRISQRPPVAGRGPPHPDTPALRQGNSRYKIRFDGRFSPPRWPRVSAHAFRGRDGKNPAPSITGMTAPPWLWSVKDLERSSYD